MFVVPPPRINKFVIITAIAVFFAVGFFALFFHGNYPQKIISRFTNKVEIPFTANRSDKAVDAWENCLVQLRAKADIVFIGDSITRRGDFASAFPNKTICNLGLGSDTIVGMTDRVSMVNAVSPEQLFVLGGINSLRDDTLAESVSEFDVLLTKIQSDYSGNVYVMSVLPISSDKALSIGCSVSAIKSFNLSIQSLTEKHGFQFIDLFPAFSGADGYILPKLTTDGVHLTDEGYSIFLNTISEYVN